MEIYRCESLQRWNKMSTQLAERHYTIFQYQYDIDCPTGFIITCMADSRPNVSIATYSADVKKAMIKYNRSIKSH